MTNDELIEEFEAWARANRRLSKGFIGVDHDLHTVHLSRAIAFEDAAQLIKGAQ